MNQCQTEIGRLREIIRENEAGYVDVLKTLGREYDKALEQEHMADTDTRQAFCAGMSEAYKNALAILAGAKEDKEI